MTSEEVLEKLANFTGYKEYDHEITDSVTAICPFCKREWYPTDIDFEKEDVYGSGGLEYHLPDCPIHMARILLGQEPYPDGAHCTVCNKITWDNMNGWKGTEEEYCAFYDLDILEQHKSKLNLMVGGCCLECFSRWYEMDRRRLSKGYF